MIVLAATTDRIEMLLGGTVATNQLSGMASYRDLTTSAFTPGRTIANTNNATAVEIAPAPAASTTRVIDYLSIFNTDTASATVTVRFNANGTTYTLSKVTLAAGEKLEYSEGVGFQVIATTGAVKQSINQGANAAPGTSFSSVILGGDVTNNNAVANTIADVTGLSASFTADKVYWFKFVIYYTAAATTTGSRWCVRASAGLATNLSFTSEYSLTSTTTTRNANVQGFDLPAGSNATSAATANNMAVLEGYFRPTADCTFIARFASEVAGSAIVAKAGSVLFYQQLTP